LRDCAGGVLLGVRGFLEDTFLGRLEHAVARHQTVIVDDLHLLRTAPEDPRVFILDAALTSIAAEAMASGKKLIIGGTDAAPWPLSRRAPAAGIGRFQAEDYACICRNLLPDGGERLDFVRIHAAAPGRNAQQLRRACTQLRSGRRIDTEAMIHALRNG
jgi:hypothetical protein